MWLDICEWIFITSQQHQARRGSFPASALSTSSPSTVGHVWTWRMYISNVGSDKKGFVSWDATQNCAISEQILCRSQTWPLRQVVAPGHAKTGLARWRPGQADEPYARCPTTPDQLTADTQVFLSLQASHHCHRQQCQPQTPSAITGFEFLMRLLNLFTLAILLKGHFELPHDYKNL